MDSSLAKDAPLLMSVPPNMRRELIKYIDNPIDLIMFCSTHPELDNWCQQKGLYQNMENRLYGSDKTFQYHMLYVLLSESDFGITFNYENAAVAYFVRKRDHDKGRLQFFYAPDKEISKRVEKVLFGVFQSAQNVPMPELRNDPFTAYRVKDASMIDIYRAALQLVRLGCNFVFAENDIPLLEFRKMLGTNLKWRLLLLEVIFHHPRGKSFRKYFHLEKRSDDIYSLDITVLVDTVKKRKTLMVRTGYHNQSLHLSYQEKAFFRSLEKQFPPLKIEAVYSGDVLLRVKNKVVFDTPETTWLDVYRFMYILFDFGATLSVSTTNGKHSEIRNCLSCNQVAALKEKDNPENTFCSFACQKHYYHGEN